MDQNSAVFHESLAELLRAGVPISQAIAVSGAAAGGGYGARAPSWSQACSRGEALATALKATGGDALEVALVDAGERSGRLPELCRLLAAHARRAVAARTMAITRLLYPALLVHLALMALAVPLVVPRVVAGHLGALAWILTGPVLLWLALAGAWLALRRSTPERRAQWLMLPGLRGSAQAWIATNTCIVLHAAAAAGMLVPQMLELAAEASGNQLVAPRLRAEARLAVNMGTPLSVALGRAGLPAELVARVAVAEKAGSLEGTLDRLAQEWHELFAQRLDRLVRATTATAYGLAMLLAAATVITMWAGYMATIYQFAREAGG